LRIVESVKAFLRGGTEQKSVPLSDSSIFEIFGAAPNTLAGPAINALTAMRVPAVACAATLIATAVGTLPVKVFSSGDGGKRATPDHAAYRLVHSEANEWTSAGALREQLTADALLHDHGFAFANRVDGRVAEFIRLDPQSVTIKHDTATGEPIYVVGQGAGQKRYAFTDILHIAAPGGSPIKLAREAIGLALTLEQHAAKLFGNGARPSGILSTEKALGDDAKRKIKASWQGAYGHGGNGGTAILDEAMKFQGLTLTSTDAQFEEMRRFQIDEIARAFRIPPHLLFELSRATLNNSEEMGRAFLTLTLRPWLAAWEWAYARVLLSPEERAAGTYVEFITDALLSADTATRAASYAQFRSMGVMTANEVRARENLPPLPGGNVLQNPYTTTGPTPANDNGEPKEEAA
jgi:HK97 family phage portal protein